jgi:hypothetical protein
MAIESRQPENLSKDAAYFVTFVSSYAIEGTEFTRESLTTIIKLAELGQEVDQILGNLTSLGVIKENK